MSGPRYRTASLDDLPRLPVLGGELTWLPVRHELGISAFGTNAYVAERAGDLVVEPHTEEGSDHEELYVVARGAARFEVDGEAFDAPAGTYVFLPDPAAKRVAHALEPATTVMSFGAPPGRAYTVSAWEPRFRAWAIAEQDRDGARALLEEAVSMAPENGWAYYDVACWHARFGEAADAVASLRRAVELRGGAVRRAAREDGDFDRVREDPAFAELVREQ